MKNRIKINEFCLKTFLFFMYFLPLLCKNEIKLDILCILTFMINGFIFIIGINSAMKKYSISMDLIFWLFMFFFMYFAPMIQYKLNIYAWSTFLTENEILYANFVILLFSISFICGKYFLNNVKIKGLPKIGFNDYICSTFKIKNKNKTILTIIVMLLALYSLSKTGLLGIIVSRNEAINPFYSGNNSAIKLIVDSVIPAFITYVVADAAQALVNKKEKPLRFIILFICLLVCFFPTTIPRYKAATIYGVIFIVICPWIKNGTKFFWLFTLGLFVVFPLLSAFRREISIAGIYNVLSTGLFESYTKGDYDAYRMLVSAIRNNIAVGCTYGYQLLGVLLFFVPSSIWKSKPIGSGAMLIKSELGNNTFSNVSCPYIAEGLVNFGLLGVILFGFILGAFIYNVDKNYWNKFNENNVNELFSPYLFLVFMLFFIMRGDLLSSFSYSCGFIATGILLKMSAK